ncbi:MAG: glutathione S-transferase family protein [Burkholderiales bacterium]
MQLACCPANNCETTGSVTGSAYDDCSIHPSSGKPMRLYYHPVSTCSRRVLMTAQHLGTKLDLVLVNLFKGEQNAPDFLKLNPNHRVPVLEHDGFVLWESHAIMQYLADMTPGQTLYPTDSRARADVNRWLFWCGQDFMPGVGILQLGKFDQGTGWHRAGRSRRSSAWRATSHRRRDDPGCASRRCGMDLQAGLFTGGLRHRRGFG